MGKHKKDLSSIYDGVVNDKHSLLLLFLNEDSNNIFIIFENSQHILHVATENNSIKCFDILLYWGANVNAQDEHGNTPLHIAITKGYFKMACMLINKGADPCICNKLNNNCFHNAVEYTANNPSIGNKSIDIIIKYKKYDKYSFELLTRTKNVLGLNPIEYGIDLKLNRNIVVYLSGLKVPEDSHIITILLHGWNDNIPDWQIIEKNFEKSLNHMVFLFSYNSLANRVAIPSLAMELRTFINDKREHYIQQKNKVAYSESNMQVKVNLVCYSTGGLIIRSFLNKCYNNEFKNIIERIVMLAPANFGSPFAKFGKSSVGRMYVGQKKVGSLFECGEELLTSLEPNSPFIWDLAHEDIFCNLEQQHFIPDRIMTTIIQGTQHYEKNIQSKVTRGDMKGTDGTVTISGASMRCIKYYMNLSEGSSNDETAIIQNSTSNVSLYLHPAHSHRSITTSLVEETDVFIFVKRALETTKQQFLELKEYFEKQNTSIYSKTHTPANLLVFQYEGNQKPVILPVLLYHKKEFIPKVGQLFDSTFMQTESRGNIVSVIREQFSYTEYHSRSRNMFYKIVDLSIIANNMLSIASDLPGCAVSLAIALKGHSQQCRIIGSTSWIDSKNDCFTTSKLGTTHLFSIAKLPSESELIKDQSPNSTLQLFQKLETDDTIDDTLAQMHTIGILFLCKTLYNNNKLEKFIDIICNVRCDDICGTIRVSIIRSLVPFFDYCTFAQEGVANLIITSSWNILNEIKSELDKTTPLNIHDYDLPSSKTCDSLYHLIYELLQHVPIKLFNKSEDKYKNYINIQSSKKVINLSKLVGEYINKISTEQLKSKNIKRERKVICLASITISQEQNSLYSINTIFPGCNDFLCKLSENKHGNIIFIHKQNEHIPQLSLHTIEIIINEYTSKSLGDIIKNYNFLYPECKFCLLLPKNNNICSDIIHQYKNQFHIFIKSNNNSNIANEFYTFSQASQIVFKYDLLELTDLLSIIKYTIEDLQKLICKKQVTQVSTCWELIIKDIDNILPLFTKIATQKFQSLQLTELRNLCLNNQAALYLSNDGLDDILLFKLMIEQSNNSNSDNIFSSICSKYPEFSKDLKEMIDLTPASQKFKPPVAPRNKSRPRSSQVRDIPTPPKRILPTPVISIKSERSNTDMSTTHMQTRGRGRGRGKGKRSLSARQPRINANPIGQQKI